MRKKRSKILLAGIMTTVMMLSSYSPAVYASATESEVQEEKQQEVVLDDTKGNDIRDENNLESNEVKAEVQEESVYPEEKQPINQIIEPDVVEKKDNLVEYTGHQQTYGDLMAVADGAILGNIGVAKRLEAITLTKSSKLNGISGDINYRVHGQTYGTQGWKTSGQLAGSTGQAKRLEAIQIYLSGQLAEQYDVYYRTHIQSYGWMNWVKGGANASSAKWSGSTGMAKRMEAIQIVFVAKGSNAPVANPVNNTEQSYISPTNIGDVMYTAHQQTYGDLELTADGKTLGVTGEAKRLEAITVTKSERFSELSGDIHYQVHGQSYGDQEWKKSGQLAGTKGKEKRIEAIRMSLSGKLGEQYDIYYRVHCQKFGWMDWTKGGTGENDVSSLWAGTSDFALRIEALQIVMVSKGEQPSALNPENQTESSYQNSTNSASIVYSGVQEGNEIAQVANGEQLGVVGESKKLNGIKIHYVSDIIDGNITYSAYMQSSAWNDWVSNGTLAGMSTNDKRMEAIKIKLTGQAANYYDVWYRVHVQSIGWLGWAKNGQAAGTADYAYRVEAIEIKLVSKLCEGPGKNSDYFRTPVSVYLDAGHGGSDPGAVNGKRKEAEDTLRIALEVQKILQEQNVMVHMARVDEDPGYTSSKLYDRTKEANKLNASLYVSMHRDSAAASATGFTIYTHNPANDNTDRANKDEWANKDSGSKALSININKQLASLGTLRNRGVVYGSAGTNSSYDLIVNRYTNMPSCLIELGFISNSSDNIIFDKYLKQHATAIAKGIMQTLGLEYT